MSMMMHTTGSRYVTLDALRTEVVTPEAMGARHKPVPHHVLVDEILDQIADRDWTVKKIKLGIAAKGRKLFGTIDLLNHPDLTLPQGGELGPTFGFRSSTNETMAIRGVAGARVFICDNMMMSGEEFIMRKKSTTRLNLPEAVSKGLNRLVTQTKLLKADIEYLSLRWMEDDDAKINIFNLFNKGCMPLHLFDDVSRLYLHPREEHPDCQPRTLLGLNNACTRSIQILKPASQFDCAVNIGRHFQMAVRDGQEENMRNLLGVSSQHA